jgi:phage shock protein A
MQVNCLATKGEFMPENNDLNADTTNPVPFEDFVRQHLVALSAQVNSLREEMVERFLQLSRQIRELNARVGRVEEEVGNVREDVKDLDDKVDSFIKEQLRMKREWREFQERESHTA